MSKLTDKEVDYIITEYKKLKSIEKTAKELNISLSEICRVAKAELRQAGGYKWEYVK